MSNESASFTDGDWSDDEDIPPTTRSSAGAMFRAAALASKRANRDAARAVADWQLSPSSSSSQVLSMAALASDVVEQHVSGTEEPEPAIREWDTSPTRLRPAQPSLECDELGVDDTLCLLLDNDACLGDDGIIFVTSGPHALLADQLPEYKVITAPVPILADANDVAEQRSWKVAAACATRVEAEVAKCEDKGAVVRMLQGRIARALGALEAILADERWARVPGESHSVRLHAAAENPVYCKALIDVLRDVQIDLAEAASQQGPVEEDGRKRKDQRRERTNVASLPPRPAAQSRPVAAPRAASQTREQRGYDLVWYTPASSGNASSLDVRYQTANAFTVALVVSAFLDDPNALGAVRAVGVRVSDAELAVAQKQLLARASSIAGGELASSDVAGGFFDLADRVLRGLAAGIASADGLVVEQRKLEDLCKQQSVVSMLRVLYSREVPDHVDTTVLADKVLQLSFADLLADTKAGTSQAGPIATAREGWELGRADVSAGLLHFAGSSLLSGLAGYKLLLLSGHAVCNPVSAPVPSFAYACNKDGSGGEGLAFLCASLVCHLLGDRGSAKWDELCALTSTKCAVASGVHSLVAEMVLGLFEKPIAFDGKDCFMAEIMYKTVFATRREDTGRDPEDVALRQSLASFLERLATSDRAHGCLSLAVSGFCYDATSRLFRAFGGNAEGVTTVLGGRLRTLHAACLVSCNWARTDLSARSGSAQSFTRPPPKFGEGAWTYIGNFLANGARQGRLHDAAPRLAADPRSVLSRAAVAKVCSHFGAAPFHDCVELPGAESTCRTMVLLPSALYVLGVSQRRKQATVQALLRSVLSTLTSGSKSTRSENSSKLFFRLWCPRLLQLHAEGGAAVLQACSGFMKRSGEPALGLSWPLDTSDYDVALRHFAGRLVPERGGSCACALADLAVEADCAAVVMRNMRYLAHVVCGEAPKHKRDRASRGAAAASADPTAAFCAPVKRGLERIAAEGGVPADMLDTVKRQRTAASDLWKASHPGSTSVPGTAFSLFSEASLACSAWSA
jgi:hypothetical protein